MNASERVLLEVAHARLRQFHTLSNIVMDGWLRAEMGKDIDKYSLLTGWLTTSDKSWRGHYEKFTQALDNALQHINGKVSGDIWRKLCSKVRATSDRAETKGTLAELSLALFLVTNGIAFDMETKLNPPKDVDFSAKFNGQEDVHVEVQWLEESDSSQRSSMVSAMYGGVPVAIDFETEGRRAIGKVLGKTKKLTTAHITLIALDCTVVPELIDSLCSELAPIFDGTGSELSESDRSIRELVDGVIWFRNDLPTSLLPVERNYLLNSYSPHQKSESLKRFVAVWSSE